MKIVVIINILKILDATKIYIVHSNQNVMVSYLSVSTLTPICGYVHQKEIVYDDMSSLSMKMVEYLDVVAPVLEAQQRYGITINH